MVQTIVTICATALLSSTLTLYLANRIFQKKYKDDLSAKLDDLSLKIKERVKQGVIEAGMQLLPKYRAEVRAGFKEAMGDTVRPEMLEKTAKNMADLGSSIMENSLRMFFGTKE